MAALWSRRRIQGKVPQPLSHEESLAAHSQMSHCSETVRTEVDSMVQKVTDVVILQVNM